MYFNPSQELLNLVKGKRIAFVGPSSHLEDKSIGSVIDGYDLVVRVNDYPQDNIGKDYGSRTDIVFDSCDTRVNEDTKLKMIRFEEKARKLKFVVLHCIQAMHGCQKDGVQIRKNFTENNIYNIPSWWIGVENFYFLENKIGTELNSGMAAIMILLEHQPRELFITGITFYLQWSVQNPFRSIYRDGYFQSETVWKNYDWSSWVPESSHEQYRQIEYFKNIVLQDRSVRIDSYLNKLLGTNHSNILEL